MPNEVLSRDQNFITVLAGVTADSDMDIEMLRVDPITKRLLVNASGIPSGLTVGTTTITGGTNGLFLYDNNGILGEVAGLTKSQADTYYYPLSTNPAGYLKNPIPVTTLVVTPVSGMIEFDGTYLYISI